MNEQLTKKIDAYKTSAGLSKWDDKSISRECKRLQDKLSIVRIEPKEYKMLRKIAEGLKVEEKVDLSAAARWAGYPEWKVKHPETMILRNIPNSLFNELVGINRNEIEMELVKVMKQDENLAAKNKAIEMGLRVTGMMEPEKGNQVNIINGGIGVAD
ncbi:MAG: hypothetical protein UT94_C0024G0024 [Candidatus Uhrbacteria bacterium GW2011_GWF2_40_263]|nr:MAG: hypothetical protein UT94_C0024G0024 [Candidatus Uhrbacteria bacterium GW2011_GWF2_40_263]